MESLIWTLVILVCVALLLFALRARANKRRRQEEDQDDVDEDTLALMIATGLVDGSPFSDEPAPGVREELLVHPPRHPKGP